MAIVLYHHPWSRAANAVWMLEEIGVEYELSHVDFTKGEQREKGFLDKNPMGKLPTLVDGDTVVTEKAAIALYLADRYAYGRLCPKVDDARRADYYRWSFFAPSVIEPAISAKMNGWEAKPSQVGWGRYEDVIESTERAITGKPFVCGEEFTMADIVFGGTIEFMLMMKVLEAKPVFTDYAARLAARPAHARSKEKNESIAKAKGLKLGG